MKKLLTLLLTSILLAGCSSTSTADATATETTETMDTFTVGMECNYAPYNWNTLEASDTAVKITEVDYCDGYDVAIARKIAEGLNKTLVIKAIVWDGLTPALTNNEIDAIIAGMTATPERAKTIAFTDPYYESEMVVVVDSDGAYANITNIQQLSGANVVGQADTIYDEVIDQIDGVNHLAPQESFSRAIVSVTQKEADALVAELPAAMGAIAANPNLKIIKFATGDGFVADTSVSVGIRQEDTDLKDSINSILSTITEDDRVAMMADATSRQPSAE